MFFLLFACAPQDSGTTPKDTQDDTDTGTVPPTDADDDGFSVDEDCDDTDPAVFPGAEEHCDGRDEDCDGAPDEDAVDASAWFEDADGDSYGAAALGEACTEPEGAVAVDGDCDDLDANVHPGADEQCDGVDNDCDPGTNEVGVHVEGVAYDSIQSAIDAAADAATVQVCGGTWAESLLITRSVTITGAAGATVDAQGAGPAAWIIGGDVRLEGLTLQGGSGMDLGDGAAGGGVHAEAAASLVLVDCVVSDNEAQRGGGVLGPSTGVLEVSGGTISGNVSEAEGGGILAVSAVFANVVFEGNEAVDGGGLFLDDGGSSTLDAVTFSNNAASNVGGAIYLGLDASLSSNTSTWDGNRSDVYAAGIYADEGSVITDVDGRFDNNASTDKGGAMYLRSMSFSGTRTTFIGNAGSWGGAAMVYESTAELDAATVQYNSADLGGAFYVYIDSVLTVRDSVVHGNTATTGGAARVKTTSTLVSEASDWGEGKTDNTPEDIDVDYTAFTFGADASFTCSNDSGVCE